MRFSTIYIICKDQYISLISITLKEETFAEETFAISRFFAEFAKVCSGEIFVIYKSRKFILAEYSLSINRGSLFS